MNFFRGLRYPFRGARTVFLRYPGMAVWWVPPILITVALMSAGIWSAVTYYDDLFHMMWSEPTGEGWLASLGRFVYPFIQGLFGILFGLATVVAVGASSSIVAAPFNDALSEALECRETGQPAPSFSIARVLKDSISAVRIAVSRLAIYLGVMIPLWFVSFLIPGVGQLIYTVVGMSFTMLYLALDYVDWPATRRGMGFRDRIGLAKKHPTLLMGFGAAVWVFLFIPVVNLLFMPAAVAGGTRLFLDLEAETRESTPT